MKSSRKYMKGGTSKYQNGGLRSPGRKTDVDKLNTYRNYTPEEKREQYTYWDKSKPGGRQYSDEPMFPLDENHPDYGTPNWKYLTDPKFRKQQEKRGITYKYDNKGRLVRLNRRGNPVGGTKAQRNERNIIPKGPQEETIRLDKKEVKKIPTPEPKLPPQPERKPIEKKVTLDKKEVKNIPIKKDDKLPPNPGPGSKEDGASFGDAFKAARAEGQREFEYKGKKYHTRRADETQEQYDAKFPTDQPPKTKTAAAATQEGKKSVEQREKEKTTSTSPEPKADMEEVKLTPKMQEDRGKPKETSTLTDTKDTDIEDTFVSADPKPEPKPAPKPEPDPTASDPDKNMTKEPKEEKVEETKEEDKTEDSSTEARRGAIVKANKKNKTMKKGKRKYRSGGMSSKALTVSMQDGGNVKVKLHKDDDKKTIGDTNLTLSGDFGVDAAKKNAANKQNNENKESNDKDANQQPKKEEKRGNYRGGSDTPQVMRDKNINRNRGNRTNNDSDDSSNDSSNDSSKKPARKTRLTRQERFDARQKRKDERLERRLEKKRQKENRRKYRKESRQYRRTMRRKDRQERRESRGMTHTGGRRISPRRWYKNLRDKLGLYTNSYDRLKDYNEFKTSRTQKPIRQYKGGGMLKAEGAAYKHGGKVGDSAYKHGGMLKEAPSNNKGLRKLPKKVRNKMGYMEDGGKTPKKKNWMQKTKERMSARYNRFKEKREQKPMSEHRFYTPDPDGGGSGYKKMTQFGTVHRDPSERGKRITAATKPGSKETVRDIYLEENKAKQKKSKEAYDKKKESWKKEDTQDRKDRQKDSEDVKKKTTRTMPMKMQDGGKVTTESVDKFLDDKYNRKSTRSGKASRPGEPRGMSKEMAKYEKDMAKRKSEVSKVKGQKKPTKPQMKKMLRTTTGRTLLRRMGYLGLALSLYDVSKKVAPETKPALKKRAKSGNYNMGRKI